MDLVKSGKMPSEPIKDSTKMLENFKTFNNKFPNKGNNGHNNLNKNNDDKKSM